MTAKDLDDTLKAIAGNAKALRDAGVVGHVAIGDISFDVSLGDAPEPLVVQQHAHEEVNPIDDGDTFGTDGPPQRRKPFSHDAARNEFEKEP